MINIGLLTTISINTESRNLMSDHSIFLEFGFSVPNVEKVNGYDSISIKGLQSLGEPGEPVLPFKTVKILLPQGTDVKDVDVAGRRVELGDSFNIEWGKTPIPMSAECGSITPPDKKIYDSLEEFPGRSYSIVSTQILRGYKILILNLYPVQYIPKSGTIFYFENMGLKVDTMPSSYSPDTFRGLPKDEVRVRSTVDNPWTIDTYRKQYEEGKNGFSLADSTESYDYLLITNNDLKASFQDLIDWKNSRGIKATFVTVEDIYNDEKYNGIDNADEIRNFIKEAYTNWRTKGCGPQMPLRFIFRCSRWKLG
jgi:hypothetical protein